MPGKHNGKPKQAWLDTASPANHPMALRLPRLPIAGIPGCWYRGLLVEMKT